MAKYRGIKARKRKINKETLKQSYKMIIRINKTNQEKINKLMLNNKDISKLINNLLEIVTNNKGNVTKEIIKVSPMDKVNKVTNNKGNVTKSTKINIFD